MQLKDLIQHIHEQGGGDTSEIYYADMNFPGRSEEVTKQDINLSPDGSVILINSELWEPVN